MMQATGRCCGMGTLLLATSLSCEFSDIFKRMDVSCINSQRVEVLLDRFLEIDF